MKNLIMTAIVAAFSVNAYSATIEFREIESKKCDDQAAVAVQNESIAFVKEQSLLSFKKKDEQGCNFADFYSVLTVVSASSNGEQTNVVVPVQSVARKNCRSEISAAPAAFFSQATIMENSVTLNDANGCKSLTLNLKPKAPAPQQ